MEKPSYSMTRVWMRWSFALGWVLIFLIVAAGLCGIQAAVDLASIVVPSAFLQIAALLGIHRVTGSMDFAAASRPADDPPARPGPEPDGVPKGWGALP